jgi:hypothetical protein
MNAAMQAAENVCAEITEALFHMRERQKPASNQA